MNPKLILASHSPRRIELLTSAGFKFEVRATYIDETPPIRMGVKKVPEHLALQKAIAASVAKNELIIAADTIVLLKNKIYGKPSNADDAKQILKALSGKMHTVITGVCIITKEKMVTFAEQTKVYFKKLSDAEINYYIKSFKPFDKAGAYAIQEWIGIIGIYKIEGDYFNVMGLPMCRLIKEMEKFITLIY